LIIYLNVEDVLAFSELINDSRTRPVEIIKSYEKVKNKTDVENQ